MAGRKKLNFFILFGEKWPRNNIFTWFITEYSSSITALNDSGVTEKGRHTSKIIQKWFRTFCL